MARKGGRGGGDAILTRGACDDRKVSNNKMVSNDRMVNKHVMTMEPVSDKRGIN